MYCNLFATNTQCMHVTECSESLQLFSGPKTSKFYQQFSTNYT